MSPTNTSPERIIYLIKGDINKTLSGPEFLELESWKKRNSENEELFDELYNEEYRVAQLKNWSVSDTEDALFRVKSRITAHRNRYRRLAYAAGLIVIASFSLLIYFVTRPVETKVYYSAKQISVMPGINTATLTLADGKKIDLNNVNTGTIAKQSGVTIDKNNDGELIYTGAGNNIQYNTIETQRGGQFMVRLPDGTKVWLNAASSLRYPASFAAVSVRRVELVGEAYFEVSKDKQHPFVVESKGQRITVLGTHFNVNTYRDEAYATTTLLEGSVEVMAMNKASLLKPGQQAQVQSGKVTVLPADVLLATAWKDGNIQFRQAPIEDIMRMVSRWYDVQVRYEGAIPKREFTGKISRASNLSVLLRILEISKVNFSLEENINGKRTLVVRP